MTIFLIVIIALLISMSVAGLSFAPWVPCRTKDLKRIFKIANLTAGEKFYDLGSGDGKTVFYAAKNYGAKAVGIEMSVPMFLVCKIKQWISGQGNVDFKFKNLFNQDLRDADVVYFFGMPDKIKNKLKLKLEKELKPGARVVAYVFRVPDWTPSLVDKPSEKEIGIYLYVR